MQTRPASKLLVKQPSALRQHEASHPTLPQLLMRVAEVPGRGRGLDQCGQGEKSLPDPQKWHQPHPHAQP